MTTITLLYLVILAFASYEICATEVPSIECGTINFPRKDTWNDSRMDRGEWPFLTALFNVKENDFFCSGTLISSKHVLTAAHCIQEKNNWKKLLPGTIRVFLGANDLTSKTEMGVQQRNVQEIHVHPFWDVYSFKHDADLAILLLSENVLFTEYVRPVCIPADDIAIDDITGSVVGWGLTEIRTKPRASFLKQSFVIALNGVDCFTEDPSAALISSPRTFCGRSEGRNSSKGDLGGGFYVENKESVWVQHGIASSLRTHSSGHADSVVVYTNVSKFKNWIIDIIWQSGATVGAAKTQFVDLNLECLFKDYLETRPYTCFVDDVDLRSNNIKVTSFSGSHKSHKTDEDVQKISFRSGKMFFIPFGIGEIFKSVKRMEILEKLGIKRIQRSNFKNLENLIELMITCNDITTLDPGSFKNLQQLEILRLEGTELTEIDERTFETNVRLRKILLNGNRLNILPGDIFRNNLLLKDVDLRHNSLKIFDESTFAKNSLLVNVELSYNSLKIIDELTFAKNIKLEGIYLNGNKLESLPRQLFRRNSLLQIVDLRNNSLKIIDESTFETNVELIEVLLNRNELEFLPRNLFRKNLLLEDVDLSYNSLKVIEGSTFETNVKLREILLQGNKLEVLPGHLFQNNSLLELVNLSNNVLRIIEIDFTSFIYIKNIFLHDNFCIHAYYEGDDNSMVIYRNRFRNSTEFNNLIRANCSSPNP